jgi:hypothetical protein
LEKKQTATTEASTGWVSYNLLRWDRRSRLDVFLRPALLRTLDQVNGSGFLDLMIGAGLWSRLGVTTIENPYPVG